MSFLDKFNLDKCDFVKIDVEGMEELVLKGSMKSIRRSEPYIYIWSVTLHMKVGLVFN